MPRVDSYVWRARVVPSILAAAPLVAFVAFVDKSPIVALLGSAIGVGAVLYASAELARTTGVKVEKKLVRAWGGLPTTRALRATKKSDPALIGRRAAVESIAQTRLPPYGPVDADLEIERTVRVVMAKIREGTTDSRILASENASYGFRRNALGLKPWSLGVIGISVLGTLTNSFVSDIWTPAWPVLGIDLLLLVFWVIVVRAGWVEEQANKFAERFFVVSEIASRGNTGPAAGAAGHVP